MTISKTEDPNWDPLFFAYSARSGIIALRLIALQKNGVKSKEYLFFKNTHLFYICFL
jgi:hypothetical protein